MSAERVLTAVGALQEAAKDTPVEPFVSELVEAMAEDTTAIELRQEIEFLKAALDRRMEQARAFREAKDEGRVFDFDPDWVIAPGATLREVIQESSFTYLEVAKSLDIDMLALRRLMDGDEPLTPEIATRLAAMTHTSESFWLERERQYREGLAAGKTDTTRRRAF